ncbi:MAG: hypothetical protein A3D24_03015 [Candidatus Blackburnbacteria bacterium RIFCSPHIGHO2_02_FULL_39_13]|uniref:Small ribosomal subunit protein bS20 n=1 Tax=Candidatus Blackburnbacteria bacterium RIFCSPLOWO2_01_FULL_40_20 TaxID=1797519 RepID=A0A1G1VAZ7_9BACT|nr:MAG: 30S ribosomal protein S20 [Microgenomates group bacterium GW2011_GWA2_39_19]OGY07453.1 MAG: hypothetical protein A2694_00325 [Candidatus Blackburnbacteria bacterium RIFCSPHIGHO2_01_FULL_40_17]OGY08453.1 MAG: hypothetical protein A3D24_03015 [Candidatus Blackburnbacteria bacterium RIFCSPHIGHO2_02_FULL_39_13]OGY12628.1 MAG: hypothetical protein A3A77_05110 [Candidatus Blackburnbacteria bacterium RIFCSPLOWO2_01_FULL_40_20]OGY14915.1 MAG: hypothetical protein A3I52_02580 [Candidatus Blackbu
MPVLKSAKKAQRQSIYKKSLNERTKKVMRDTIRFFRSNPTLENLKKAQSVVDRAAKKHVIHKNRAARLKKGFAKLASQPAPKKAAKKK